MTSAGSAQPLTALALLAGQGQDFPEAISRRLLSVEVGGDLGRLNRLPDITRQAAINEVTAAAAGVLDVSLIGVLVAGWREHHDLTAAARRTLATPGSVELVHVATHEVTMTEHPSVTILVDGARIATIELGLSLVLDITALLAGISAGRLVAVHAGRCDVTASLSIDGTEVLTRQGRLELPGAIRLGIGIRLLAAKDYPPGARQPGSADDPDQPSDQPQQMDPAAEEAVVPPAPDTAAP
jgi:hypothetical protein